MRRKHYNTMGNMPQDGVNFTKEEGSPIEMGFYKVKVHLKLPKNVSPVSYKFDVIGQM